MAEYVAPMGLGVFIVAVFYKYFAPDGVWQSYQSELEPKNRLIFRFPF